MARFVLNFKAQFARAIQAGEKRQTIRKNRADGKRPQPGDVAVCYTGLRTRQAKHLLDGQITRCRSVRIEILHQGELIIDGERLSAEARTEFAHADGFPSWPAMLDFFRGQCSSATFDGFCVEWEV